MPFQRVWDCTCPVVYDQWEGEGASWVIQDLLPEDDKDALELLADVILNEATLCVALGVKDEEESVQGMKEYWGACIAQRMSLGCYRIINGNKQLVGLNGCIVKCKGEGVAQSQPIIGNKLATVYEAMEYLKGKVDAFEYIGADKLLYGTGLVVRKDYRGNKLGSKLLAARERLALSQGLKGSSTVFTGVASQKLAERAGFKEIASSSLAEFAEQGLGFPKDDTKIIKLMYKKYYVS